MNHLDFYYKDRKVYSIGICPAERVGFDDLTYAEQVKYLVQDAEFVHFAELEWDVVFVNGVVYNRREYERLIALENVNELSS